MPIASEPNLRKITEQNQLSGLYLLYGEEPYLVSQWANRIIKKVVGKDASDFNFQRFSGDVSADDLGDASEALPFMADKKCVAVSDLTLDGRTPNEMKKLEQLISEVPETTVLLIYQLSPNILSTKDKKWKKILDLCKKYGTVVTFPRKSQQELSKILCTGASKRNCTLSKFNADKIIASAGTDLSTLFQELEKLCAYTGEGEITKETIDQLVTKTLEVRIYDLSKWILAGNYDKAYLLLDQLFAQNVEPISLLSVLSGTYMDLYRVRSAIENGNRALDVGKYFDYSRREFVLTRAEREVRNLSMSVLRKSLDVLEKADLALKSSRGNRRIILEKTLAKLLLTAKGD
ncbi:MAG: DNA polymerase III subunit delta [Clostridiales bacterium]|jgi:DNA polymerase-3 subunit delta|nr:DNA polymerase III subunit delta [Clostridiales bacterium]MCI1960516.1 DNA polymerase III subunit delta [Clostridiales bacterium]MCI2021003.1 DNA polymerase III subunit delta [Clostridiales bacterium]MCI2025386.1 DNA polymerase III subunit delta [Clostridiales bacterium]